MLNNQGFSVLEMLFSIIILSIVLVAASNVYFSLYNTMLGYYYQLRLEKIIQLGISPLIKDIRRAGFIANNPNRRNKEWIVINSEHNCIFLRYDNHLNGYWQNLPIQNEQSDVFAYRFYNNNLEYKAGSIDCKGAYWTRIFDRKEVIISKFMIKNQGNIIKLHLSATLTQQPAIIYDLIQVVRNENAR